MMNLMDGGDRHGRLPKREIVELVGLAALNVAGALLLIPVVALNGLAGARPFSKSGGYRPEPVCGPPMP